MEQPEQHQLTISELYNLILPTLSENPELQDTYDKIRYGINLKFDIYLSTNNMIQINNKRHTAIIGPKEHNLSEYWTEMEQRRLLMINVMDQMTPEELIHARTEEHNG